MGVDPEIFRRTENYAPWKGIGPLRLFSCGRLNPSKGHQDLVKAVSLLKSLVQTFTLKLLARMKLEARVPS